jgi:four helix bundle protein
MVRSSSGTRTLRRMMPYEGLKAWQACHALFLETYRVTGSFPRSELYGLTAQMRRAAFSAAANLAEGSAKRGAREFRRYIDITLGSLSELSYAIRAVQDLELGAAAEVRRLDALRQQAGRLTWGLYRRICTRAGEGP